VIIFWNAVEILGRWGFFKEFWIEPSEYILEMILILVVFIALTGILVFERKKPRKIEVI
jgi:hypothetical protein